MAEADIINKSVKKLFREPKDNLAATYDLFGAQ